MTDEELICRFMEPVPGFRGIDYPHSVGGWWIAENGKQSRPADSITLDALHEVEERLTEKQGWDYLAALQSETADIPGWAFRHLWHATAKQKIAALAKVLR
jgi:hypothetical protein